MWMTLLLAQSLASPPITPTAAAVPTAEAAYVREVEAWRQQRLDRLTAEGGWLTLAGLHWLEPGDSSFGAAPTNRIILPASAPPVAGVFHVEGASGVRAGGIVSVEVAKGVNATVAAGSVVTPVVPARRLRLRSDAEPQGPDVLALGPSLTLQIIDRGGRLGVRVKDAASPTRATFKGLRWYAVNPAWRVKARFIPHATPTTLKVPSVVGVTEDMQSPGIVELTFGGKTYPLVPVLEPGETRLFFIFRDATAGRGTYGAGRFLYADPPRDGVVVLDFNEAYSPPCAFTAYATCPLPPQQNRLPFEIPAGERYDGPSHGGGASAR